MLKGLVYIAYFIRLVNIEVVKRGANRSTQPALTTTKVSCYYNKKTLPPLFDDN